MERDKASSSSQTARQRRVGEEEPGAHTGAPGAVPKRGQSREQQQLSGIHRGGEGW